MKVIEATPEKGSDFTGSNGKILSVKDTSFTVKCCDGIMKVTAIQMEGKKKMSVYEYLKGNEIEEGTILI